MEKQLRNRLIRTLPEGRRGTSGAIAGSDSMQTDSGRQLSRRTPTGITRNTTAENNSLTSTNTDGIVLDDIQSSTNPSARPRRRTKWSLQMNKYIVRSYLYITNLETDLTNYRNALHQMVTTQFPELSGKTVQNIMDQKRSILIHKRISEIELEQIKREVAVQIDIENTNINNDLHSTQPLTNQELNEIEPLQNNNRRRESLMRSSQPLELDPVSICWIETEIEYKDTDPLYRPKISKLKTNNTTEHILLKVDQKILERINENCTLEELHCLVFIGAITVLKLHNQKIFTTENNYQNNKNLKKWTIRLERKIVNLRKEVNIITRSMEENSSQKVKKRTNNIFLKYQNEKNQTIINVLDLCKQKLAATAKRLRRYKSSQKRREENHLFENNEKMFYKSFIEPINSEEQRNLNISDANNMHEYWKKMWSDSVTHVENAEWLKNEKRIYERLTEDMNQLTISETHVTNSIKSKSNWKSPGIDGIHNFWLKRFKSTHKQMAVLFTKLIQGEIEIPSFMTKGLTHLIPKKSVNSTNPADYRPITCLPTIYKLLTSIICDAISNHLEQQHIMHEEQKGCRKMSQGCKEQLIIDGVITNQANHNKRSLYVAYVDFQKAFDSMPHSWLMEILKIYKINKQIIYFLKNVMSKWNTDLLIKLNTGNHKIGNIQIKRGIFQGDSLSALWFCMGLNPLSSLLKNSEKGYKLTSNFKINHLMYMDDIKLFASTKSDLNNILKITELFSSDIRMNFGLNKCKIQAMKRGKLINTDNYEMENMQQIELIDQLETYKYLGYAQSMGIDNKIAKEEVTTRFHNRLKFILNSKLCALNKCRAINTFAIPVLSYSFGVLKWSSTELDQLNISMRTLSTKYRMHHPKSSIERFHLPRIKGGRGIIDLHLLHDSQINTLENYFIEKMESTPLHKAIFEMKEYLLTLNLQNSQIINNRLINDDEKINRWMEKELHGRYPAQLKKPFIDEAASFMWLRYGSLFSETEGFILAIQDQVIATRNYRKYIIKEEGMLSDKCRLCGNFPENIDHLIAGCTVLASTDYTKRHNNVGKIVHQELCTSYGILKEKIPYYKYDPLPVIDNEYCKIYWDRDIITDTRINNNRPDIVLTDKLTKITYVIDIAVPLANNLQKKHNEKIEKYTLLANEIKDMWRQDHVIIIPIIIGALGEVPVNLKGSLEKIGLKPNIFKNLQKTVLLDTTSTIRKVLQINI